MEDLSDEEEGRNACGRASLLQFTCFGGLRAMREQGLTERKSTHTKTSDNGEVEK
jgi:hypothetical protein